MHPKSLSKATNAELAGLSEMRYDKGTRGGSIMTTEADRLTTVETKLDGFIEETRSRFNDMKHSYERAIPSKHRYVGDHNDGGAWNPSGDSGKTLNTDVRVWYSSKP